MDKERTVIKLQKPIEFGSAVIEELAFRSLKGKDLRRLSIKPGEEMDMVLTLASRGSNRSCHHRSLSVRKHRSVCEKSACKHNSLRKHS